MSRLGAVRYENGLTIRDLSELSDISPGAIYRIEQGDSLHKTHVGVAQALADVFDLAVEDLFDEKDLTHLGRPPHTGRPLRLADELDCRDVVCPDCHLVLCRAGTDCYFCETG